MNTLPPDPLQTGKEQPVPEAGTQFNGHAIKALRRELFDTPDIDAVITTTKRRNSARRFDQPEVNEQQEIDNALREAPSSDWSALDKLAFRRAGAAIVAADGRGEGVTKAEARAVCSRDPGQIGLAARQIVARLADPAIDSLVIERDDEEVTFVRQASS